MCGPPRGEAGRLKGISRVLMARAEGGRDACKALVCVNKRTKGNQRVLCLKEILGFQI